VLTFLVIGTAYSEPKASDKPFKVCPEIVTAKDTPCRVLGPTVAVVSRMEIEDKKDKEIKELKEKIKILEEEIKSLKNIKPNVDVEKPTTTRAIRG
jgi:hypothetical protein